MSGWPERLWYTRPGPVQWLLWLPSLLFCLLAAIRRTAYRRGWRSVPSLPVPVIVVGNLTAGGSGKTPLVASLVAWLREAGYSPGVVSRGYGGRAAEWPQTVCADSDPREVGDEPVLLARRTGVPVVVAPDRVAAAQRLIGLGVDVIVSDDGLQHYRLARDIEIAVVDGVRRFGNGLCLPAGPLRERPGRLRRVDFIVANGDAQADEVAMRLRPGPLCRVDGGGRDPAPFTGPVHAVAGIGHPARFFAMLSRAGMTVQEHPFPDHHAFRPEELRFGDGRPVVMTEKDAVKCRRFAAGEAWWYLPVEAELPATFRQALLERLNEKR